MLSIILLIITIVATIVHLIYNNKLNNRHDQVKIFLQYLLFFNVGIMGLIAFYAHVFDADATAEKIGWDAGSPFQFEMGMTNLAFGILGVLCLYYHRLFWLATSLGAVILFLGCFYGHLYQYFVFDNVAPYNIGVQIWFQDLIVPILLILSVGYLYFYYPKEFETY